MAIKFKKRLKKFERQAPSYAQAQGASQGQKWLGFWTVLPGPMRCLASLAMDYIEYIIFILVSGLFVGIILVHILEYFDAD
jgi:hypothetical protein|tara:strand:- start:1202 stop:1444 length:243 start_codon:yes stop_codon:yes gene_type:complete